MSWVGRWRVALSTGTFPSAPRRTALASFPRTRLSRDSCRSPVSRRPPCMDRRVTGSAHDQRFPLPCRHQTVPLRYRFVPTALEIRQLADMMHLDVERAAAQLARVGLEPFE